MLTDLVHQGRPVVVALRPDVVRRAVEVTDLRSIHGKDNVDSIRRWIEAETNLWTTENGKAWLRRTFGPIYPALEAKLVPRDNILPGTPTVKPPEDEGATGAVPAPLSPPPETPAAPAAQRLPPREAAGLGPDRRGRFYKPVHREKFLEDPSRYSGAQQGLGHRAGDARAA